MTQPLELGQTTDEYAASFGEVWIKGFKEGATRIRFCQEPEASPDHPERPPFVTWVQHYNRALGGYFPCSKKEDCVGCNHPEERTRELQRQYYFNALDENGRLNVYRLGVKAYKILKDRYQRIGTIMDRDFTIIRTGDGLDTVYVPEPGDKYDLELPTELHNIKAVLGAKYLEAQQLWREEQEADAAEAAVVDSAAKPAKAAAPKEAPAKPAEEASATAAPAPAKKAAAKAPIKAVKKAAPAKPAKEEIAAATAAVDADLADKLSFEDMSTPDLVKYLTGKVEFGPRTPRSKLIEMAEALEPPF